MERKIRMRLVDDEQIVCEAIAALLEMVKEIALIGTALNAERWMWRAGKPHHDVILVGLHLPDKPDVEVIGDLLKSNPGVRIVILTGYAEEREVAAAFRAGAISFVLKTQSYSQLAETVKNASHGQSSIPPQIAKTV